MHLIKKVYNVHTIEKKKIYCEMSIILNTVAFVFLYIGVVSFGTVCVLFIIPGIHRNRSRRNQELEDNNNEEMIVSQVPEQANTDTKPTEST